MIDHLSVLILEDRPADAELMLAALDESGISCEYHRVDDEAGFVAGLEQRPTIILADYHLPQFSALHALDVLQARGLTIPLIVVSGNISEELAVQCIQRGAADYLLKDRLRRLGPAVLRALEEHRLRRDEQEAQRQLQASEARFRTVVEQGTDAVVIVDSEAIVRYASPTVARIIGYSAEELLGMGPPFYAHPKERARNKEVFAEIVATPNNVTRFECRLHHKEGTWRPVEIVATNLLADPAVEGVVATFHDLTQQQQLSAERQQLLLTLARSEKLRALGQLSAGVAHDVNNALATISGAAELLKESLSASSAATTEGLRDVDIILRAAKDAAHTVQRLQAFARPSDAQEVGQRELVVLDDLLEDVVALTRPRWRDQARTEGRHIDVQVRTGGAPPVLAVPADLRAALVNLVNNAADALPTGGQITVASGSEVTDDGTPRAILSVTDNGVGMDNDTLRRVFEPFFTTKVSGKGTGLGLAMVHGIISRLGGTVRVESMNGQGTTITMCLPVASSPPGGPTPQQATEPRVGNALRILFVEDEAPLRDVVGRMLEGEGHTVFTVADAEAALSVLTPATREWVDIVVTDVGLPGMTGWELFAILRSWRPNLPVVIATGWASEADDNWLKLQNISRDRLIAKPYTLGELRRAISVASM